MEINNAIYLIDDEKMSLWGKLTTGWDYINDGEGAESALQKEGWLLNTDNNKEVYVRRDCNKSDGDRLTLEVKLKSISGSGLYIKLGSRTDEFLTVSVNKEELFVAGKKACDFAYGVHFVKVDMDVKSGIVHVYVDEMYCGSFGFDKTPFTFNCLRIGYGADDKGSTLIMFARLYVNYLVNESNRSGFVGEMPNSFEVKAPKTAHVERKYRVEGEFDVTYASTNRKGAKSVVKRTFDKASGRVAFEIKYHTAGKTGLTTIALCSRNKNVMSVTDEGDGLCCRGSLLRKHSLNVWQTLRIEADTVNGTALVWLNGKKTKTVDLENTAKFVDNFRITYEAGEKSTLMFSDMFVWVMPDEPEDYVPAPVIPKKKGDYAVGMNICSLWREGTHAGWDCISPFDDIKPVLGYYDEGLPETADWEIKFLAEHGVDYELYCWYSSEGDAPLKKTGLSSAIHDGHFHAKYADSMKFALLWEAANCHHPKGLEAFKKYLVPYWIDYFFSDPRYMRVDNKAVMSCFGVWCVEKDLGGEANTREGLQYLRDEVKKLGYDDLIIMGCHADPNMLKRLGFDAFHAYHWGSDGYKLQTNIDCNNRNIAMNAVHIVPTVSVGFKNIGWGGERRPNLACQDMYNGLVYCRDELLPKFEKDSWKSKMLHLSTWNEYGEGTYMMPSGLNGFGYLDAVRRALCEDAPHTDVTPTKNQQARIGYLHLQNRHILQRTKYDVRPLPKTDTLVAKYEFKTNADMEKWEFTRMTDLAINDGCLCGKAVENEPFMVLKDTQFDATSIGYAKVTFRNADVHGSNTGSRFFASVSDDQSFKPKAYTAFWCYTKEMNTYMYSLDDKDFWHDTITAIRFDPLLGAGEFAIESIALYAPCEHTTLYGKNGKQLYFGDYLENKGKELYVPLDPQSGLYSSLGCKFEWFKDEGRLEMWTDENKLTFVVDKAYAVKNGESFTLTRPVYLKDGIPTISLSDLKKLFGLETDEKGSKIYLK